MALIVLLIISMPLLLVNSEIQPKLITNLYNSGFHRNLEYNLQFQGLQNKKCEFVLVQNLPSAVYVNIDQLNDLKRFKKIQTYVPTTVDVELTAEKAYPIIIYLYGVLKNLSIINLPIHFRYHTCDIRNNLFVKVTINSPTILMRCRNQTDGNETKINAPCSSSYLIVEDNIAPEICEWKELEFINNPTILSASIPVGNRKLWILVAFGTILTSWLGCLFLVYSVHQRRKLHKKL